MLTVLKLQIAVVVFIANIFLICCRNNDQEDLTRIYKNLLDNEHFNLENLAEEYSKVCPFGVDDYRLGNCPNCSYEPDCIINNKCCPDVIYGYLDYKCVSVVQREGKSSFNATSYSMIASCPSSSRGSGRPSQNSKEEIPVTSLITGLTYQTKQFARCNDDDNSLITWNTSFHCLETLPPWGEPIQITSFEDLVQNIELFNCEIRFSITAANVPLAAVCSGGEEYYNNKVFIKPKRLVNECNMTGLWEHFDPDNVFCYICNPGLSFQYYKTKPVISTCNWIKSNIDIKNACTRREQTPYYLPFKNVFCKLCNIMPNSFFSVNDELYDTWVHARNISEQTVAETVGGLFHSENSNDFDTELIGNISYNSTNYSCLIPLQKMNGSTRSNARKISNCDRGNTNDDVEVPLYNCSSMFQKYLINGKSGLNVFNRSQITDTLYFSYILYIYLCDDSVEINRFCEVDTEEQICSLKSNQSERAISCMLCQTGDIYFFDYHYRGSGFDVLMKNTCSNLLEDVLFLDIISLLVAARESGCSIWNRVEKYYAQKVMF
ncbi:uncharacterized protein LOC128552488 [Mercenaria mercenaria]|uniref:uncharacterized protein LOC128552488 n=1 Tax=Mercenaria mercenaria TaxID=6596 RepID=UPI00234F1830|nr:uncharacterized protein LOC128552488 [Mercenaria mercenaria]